MSITPNEETPPKVGLNAANCSEPYRRRSNRRVRVPAAIGIATTIANWRYREIHREDEHRDDEVDRDRDEGGLQVPAGEAGPGGRHPRGGDERDQVEPDRVGGVAGEEQPGESDRDERRDAEVHH
jgi:hypothetical protein